MGEGKLVGAKLLVSAVRWMRGKGGGGQRPVRRSRRCVAAIREVVTPGGSVGVHKAPLTLVALAGVPGRAVVVALS